LRVRVDPRARADRAYGRRGSLDEDEGLQYYLPPSGNFFLSANFSQMKSNNIASFLVAPGATPTAAQLGTVFNKVQWGDINLFWNVTPALRFGAEYAYFRETYADGLVVKNQRGQFSGYYVF